MGVSLRHIIHELERLRPQAAKKYAEYVNRGSMTPFTRDSKLAVLDALLEAAREAARQKTNLIDQLKKLPV